MVVLLAFSSPQFPVGSDEHDYVSRTALPAVASVTGRGNLMLSFLTKGGVKLMPESSQASLCL